MVLLVRLMTDDKTDLVLVNTYKEPMRHKGYRQEPLKISTPFVQTFF